MQIQSQFHFNNDKIKLDIIYSKPKVTLKTLNIIQSSFCYSYHLDHRLLLLEGLKDQM